MSGARAKSGKRGGRAVSPSPGTPAHPPRVGPFIKRHWLLLGALFAAAAAFAFALPFMRRPAVNLLAQHEVALARQSLASGHPQEAAAAFRRALHWNPGLAEARGLLGGLELEQGRLEHAFLEFQSLTELQPRNPEGWLGLARVRKKAGQPEEAAAAMDEVLELAPETPGARTVRSELRYEVGRYQGAYLDAQRAVQTDAKDARAWLVLVRAAAQVQGTKAGLAAAERGLASTGGDVALVQELSSLRASNTPAAVSGPRLKEDSSDRAEKWPGALGSLMRDVVSKMQRKDWFAAEQLAASAGTRYPATMMGPWLVGVIALTREQFEAAEKSLLSALDVAPRSHRAVTNLVAVWWKKNGPRYAGDQLVALSKANPGFEYPLPIAAHAYLEADQPPLAESTARLGFETAPDSVVPYRDVADLYLELDRAGEAMGVCEQGLARFPDDAMLQLRKARASLLLGDRDAAIGTYEQVLSQHGDNQAAAGALATLLVETRSDGPSHERALELVRSLEHDGPLEPEVLGAIGRVYLKVPNDGARARSYLEAAVRGAPGDASLRFYFAQALAPENPALAVRQLRTALSSGATFPEEVEARRLLDQLAAAGR
jgi:cellulose synthase operon protein C